MDDIKKIYFHYCCNIGMYIQDNLILDPENNNIVNIMKKNESLWHAEFQNTLFTKIKSEYNIDIFIALQSKLFLSIKSIKELYNLAKISAETILNNNLNNKKVFILFYYIILLTNKILLVEKKLVQEDDNLFKCLKRHYYNDELYSLINLTNKIIDKDLFNKNDPIYKKMLKLIQYYS